MDENYVVALFKTTQSYSLRKTNEIFQLIEEFLGDGLSGHSTNTSAWMNRYCILERDNTSFVIIPSKIPCCQNNVSATSSTIYSI